MRKRSWLKLIKDYDCTMNFHLGNANVVADALGRKERLKMLVSSEELIREFEKKEMEVKILVHASEQIIEILLQPELLEKIQRCQEKMMEVRRSELTGEELQSSEDEIRA